MFIFVSAVFIACNRRQLVADSLKWVHFIFGEWNSLKFPGNVFTAYLLALRLSLRQMDLRAAK